MVKNQPSLCQRRNGGGINGEREVNNYLYHLSKEDEYLFTNILLPLKNGCTTEIDTLLITRKGIFCIEIKNWKGYIEGDDYSKHWIQKYKPFSSTYKQLHNPVKQNENHCFVIERLLKNEFNVENVVIFLKIKNRRNLHSRFIYELNEFIEYFNSLPNNIINKEDVFFAAEKLKKYKATRYELETHKREIKNKYKDD